MTGFTFVTFTSQLLFAAALPIEKNVEWQPFVAQVTRLIEATEYLGSPFSSSEKAAIAAAMQQPRPQNATEGLQVILDRHCLFGVQINPEMRVKVCWAGDAGTRGTGLASVPRQSRQRLRHHRGAAGRESQCHLRLLAGRGRTEE